MITLRHAEVGPFAAADDSHIDDSAPWTSKDTRQLAITAAIFFPLLFGSIAWMTYNPRRRAGDCRGWKWGKTPACGD